MLLNFLQRVIKTKINQTIFKNLFDAVALTASTQTRWRFNKTFWKVKEETYTQYTAAYKRFLEVMFF